MDIGSYKNKIKISEAGTTEPIPYFYIDGKNHDLVNIGFGFHYDSWDKYEQLFRSYSIKFTWKDFNNKNPVTIADVRADFDLVKLKKADARAAERITLTRANAVILAHIFDIFYLQKELLARNWYNSNTDISNLLIFPKLLYPVFDQLPENARFALIDMFYNAGPGVMNSFRHLKAAIKMGEWTTAIKECRFKEYALQAGIKTRNDARASLFRELAMSPKSNFLMY